jgi:transposase
MTIRRYELSDFEWSIIFPLLPILKFNKRLYRKRKLVERFFNKLKHFRAIATRFEKDDANYLPLVKLASAKILMRFMSRCLKY